MNELPAGWRRARLGDVADTALGKMLDRGRSQGLSTVRYLRNFNVQWGTISTEDLLEMELHPDEMDRFQVLPGDLLVCEGGEIGRAAIWRGNIGYIGYQKALHRIRSRGELDLRYLRYLLESYASDGTLARLATGSTIMHLPQQRLREVGIPLPPLLEQHRIVDILEDHLSRLDAARAACGRALARLTGLRLSWLRMHLQGAGAVVPLGEIVLESKTGWDRARALITEGEDGYKYLKMHNITNDGGLDLRDVVAVSGELTNADRYRLSEGDVVFNNRNSAELVGKTAFVPRALAGWTYNNNLVRLRFRSDVNPRFAAMQMNSPRFRDQLRGLVSASTNVAAVYTRDLLRLSLWLPTLSEQERLAVEYSVLMEDAGRFDEALQVVDLRTRRLRRAVLDAAFSGRLTDGLSDLDRVEELAGV